MSLQFPVPDFESDESTGEGEPQGEVVDFSSASTVSSEQMQGPLVEPEPVRTAAEILGVGFWAYSPSARTIQVSERGMRIFAGETKPREVSLEALISAADRAQIQSDLEGSNRFQRIVESISGRPVLMSGWPESGYRSRMVGTITEVPSVAGEPPEQEDQLLIQAVEAGVESMLVLRAIRSTDSRPVDFEVAEVNSRGAQMLGQSRQDAVGKLLTQLIPETRTSGVIQEYAAVMLSQLPTEKEFHASPGGFQQIWIKQRVVPLEEGVAIFSHDITQSRRIGESVDRAKRMFERIASTTPDVLLLWDAQSNRFIYTNRSLGGLIGAPSSKSMFDLTPRLTAEDRSNFEGYLQRLSKVEDESVVEEVFKFLAPGSTVRHLLFRTSGFDKTAEGRPQTFLTTVQDVTDQITHSTALETKMAELAEARAQLEARHVELESLNLRLSDLASTDALTGIKNRRAFQEKLDEEAERAQRYNARLALILADVDHFKPYNDKFGHPAGDQALKGFAQVLIEVCRKSDTIARYGGEEFAIILPNTGAEEAALLGDRIRASLVGTIYGRQGVTASFGCAEYLAGKDGKERLVGSADKALYQSKNEGRDRVTIFRD